MKHYKVILSLYKDGRRITCEDEDKIILEIVENNKNIFDYNKNKEKDKHLPVYYNDIYYFGNPIVLTGIDEKSLEHLLTLFILKGLSFWITYLHEMFSFEQLKKDYLFKPFFKDFRMENINEERGVIFIKQDNLVNEYKNRYAIIQNKTKIKEIIEATK
jgi:hypothetical protein